MALPVYIHLISTPIAAPIRANRNGARRRRSIISRSERSVRGQATGGFVARIRLDRYLGVLFPDNRHRRPHQRPGDDVVEASDRNDLHAALDRIGNLREILCVVLWVKLRLYDASVNQRSV